MKPARSGDHQLLLKFNDYFSRLDIILIGCVLGEVRLPIQNYIHLSLASFFFSLCNSHNSFVRCPVHGTGEDEEQFIGGVGPCAANAHSVDWIA